MRCILYTYAMACDSGFAPCVDGGLLTLVCCKGGRRGGMRAAIAKDFVQGRKSGAEVWVLGLCGLGLARESGRGQEAYYSPIYLAKVTDVLEMKDYYRRPSPYAGRADHGAYTVRPDGALAPVPSPRANPHWGDRDAIRKDIGGTYAILSRRFLYWGQSCGSLPRSVLIDRLGRHANGILCSTPAKKGIDKHYRGYIVCREFGGLRQLLAACGWSEEAGPVVRAAPISQVHLPHADDNDEDALTCHGCH